MALQAIENIKAVAKVLGMDLDQLNASLATVITVTRQAPVIIFSGIKKLKSWKLLKPFSLIILLLRTKVETSKGMVYGL